VLFLDDYDHVVKVQYINDVDEIYKNDWNRYEQLIEVPERATKMMFQIWARGGKEGVGDMEIRNYSIIPYKELITVDSIALFEGNRPERFLFAGNSVNGEDSEDKERVIYIKSDAMKKDIELENLSAERYLLNVVESPNPLWTMSLTGVRGDLAVNGTTMGYIIEENGKGSIQIIFRGIYLLGLVFLGLGLPISVLIYLNIERINYWFRCIFCNCRR